MLLPVACVSDASRRRRRRRPAWLRDAERIDLAVYEAITGTPTPSLDAAIGGLTRVADYSRLWLALSVILAATRGARGRRAAARGLGSVVVTSAVANLLIKPLYRRRRPDRPETPARAPNPDARQQRLPVRTFRLRVRIATRGGQRPALRRDPNPGPGGDRRILARPQRSALSSRRDRRSATRLNDRAGNHPPPRRPRRVWTAALDSDGSSSSRSLAAETPERCR